MKTKRMTSRRAKGLCAAFLAAIMTVCSFATAFAEIYWYNFPNYGVSFDLSSDWVKIDEADSGVLLKHYTSDRQAETVDIGIDTCYGLNNLDYADENALKQIFDNKYSNQNLANVLSQNNNGVYVTVTSDSVVSKFDWYNGRKWYRYEKAYSARATNYYTGKFYLSMLVTVVDGRMIFVEYERNMDRNHFSDLAAMMDSIVVTGSNYRAGIEDIDPNSLAGKIRALGGDAATDVISIFINGELITPDSDPVMVNDRTLVPIRAVAEYLGYTVGWDDASQSVTMFNSNNTIKFTIDSTTAIKNGRNFTIDVPAQIIGERTYLPLRAVAEAMDAEVEWNGEIQAVEIYN